MRPLRRSLTRASLARDRRLRKSFGRALGIGLIFTTSSALGQQPGAGDIPLEAVDVRGERREYRIMEPSLFKFPDLLKDTPQSITVIPRS
jgi:hypothetical protein